MCLCPTCNVPCYWPLLACSTALLIHWQATHASCAPPELTFVGYLNSRKCHLLSLWPKCRPSATLRLGVRDIILRVDLMACSDTLSSPSARLYLLGCTVDELLQSYETSSDPTSSFLHKYLHDLMAQTSASLSLA
jgi:hypothetical protein